MWPPMDTIPYICFFSISFIAFSCVCMCTDTAYKE